MARRLLVLPHTALHTALHLRVTSSSLPVQVSAGCRFGCEDSDCDADVNVLLCSALSSMAALWLQTFSLLVLMMVSWPGSQAVGGPQHLCGSHLVDALYLVCGDRGFFYNPRRDVDPLLGETTNHEQKH